MRILFVSLLHSTRALNLLSGAHMLELFVSQEWCSFFFGHCRALWQPLANCVVDMCVSCEVSDFATEAASIYRHI